MADKIEEIMESGHLRKLDHIGEAVPVLELFMNIWGAGTKTAQLWYQQVKTHILVQEIEVQRLYPAQKVVSELCCLCLFCLTICFTTQ